MGSKAPAFIGDVKTFSFVRKRGSEVSMPCNAQGHPVPVTRYQIATLFMSIPGSNTYFAFQYLHDGISSNCLVPNDFHCGHSNFLAFETCRLRNSVQSWEEIHLIPCYVIRTSRHEEAKVLEWCKESLVRSYQRGRSDSVLSRAGVPSSNA